MKNFTHWKVAVNLLCILLYIWSLKLPAFLFHGTYYPTMKGYDVLSVGWIGLIILDPRWYANILFFLCFLITFSSKRRKIIPWLGLILAISSILFPIYYFPNDLAVLVNERGIGVYVWFLSLSIIFIKSIVENNLQKSGAA